MPRHRIRESRLIIEIGAFIFLIFFFAGPASCATLVWDPVQGAQGYRVYWGTSQGNYSNNVNAGGETQYPLDRLPLADNMLYYISVTAYNSAGESGYATPVSYSTGDHTPPYPPKNPWVE